VDSDSGRFALNDILGASVIIGSPTVSAQAEWFDKYWGKTNLGSICPSAPERRTKDQNSLGFSAGSVGSAWVSAQAGFIVGEENDRRVGSYAANAWMTWWQGERRAFRTEGEVQDASRTPVFGDGTSSSLFGLGLAGWATPTATDLPAKNLKTGDSMSGAIAPGPGAGGLTFVSSGMSIFTIPRHGSRPSTILTNHPASEKLPGAINVAFYDGHSETVKLDALWQIYWHKDYVPPAKRPGLK
jgi:prepilin-type processing-associated H-X9-DG protein